MTHVLHVGPVESGEGTFHLLCAVDRGEVSPPAVGRTLKLAAAELAPTLAGAVTCDPSLAAVASRNGWAPAEPERSVALVRMSLAFTLAHGPGLFKSTDPDLVEEICQTAADYHRARPWDRFVSDVALSVKARGPLMGERDLSVLGAGGEEFGAALYDKPGSVDLIARSGALAAPGGAPRFDSIVLLLDAREPRYLVDAVKAVTGAAIAPLLMRVKRGRPAEPTSNELRLLLAALKAVVLLGTSGRSAAATFEHAEAEVSIADPPLQEAHSPEPAYPDVGRNEPCPCGSGRKFKRCHGDGTKAPAPAAELRKSRLHDLDAQVSRRLCDYAVARFGDDFRRRIADEKLGGPEFAMPHCLHGLRFDGKTVGVHALSDPSVHWSSEEREWLEAQQRAWPSLWEVEAVSSDGQLALFDLVTGTHVVVLDVSAARQLGFRDVVLVRVVAHAGTSVLCGTWPEMLDPEEASKLLGALSAEQLRDPAAGPLIELFREATRPKQDKPQEGQVTNTDGDEVLFTRDFLRFDSARRAEVIERLRGLGDVYLDEDSPKETRLSVSKPLNAMHPAWRKTLTGTLRVERGVVELESNSVARADTLRKRVEEALSGLVTFQRRTREDPTAQLPGFDEAVSFDVECLPEGPWLEALARLETEASWLRAKHKSLGGLTPVEAVKRRSLREPVHLSLKQLEHRWARSGDAVSSGLRLRRALGLSSAGAYLKPDEAWASLGGGLALSDALAAFVAPLLPDVKDEELALKLGAAVWNALVDGEEREEQVTARVRAALEGVSASQAERLVAEVPWLISRKRHLFDDDRRTVVETILERTPGRLGLKVAWTAPEKLAKAFRRLGMQPGDKALDLYDPSQPPLEFAWKAVGAGHREELVLEYHRRTKAPFGQDLYRHARLHVLAEDADCESFPKQAVETLDRLMREGMGRHDALHVVGEALLAQD